MKKPSLVPWLALPLATVAVVLIGAYTFLLPLVEGVVARSVEDRLGLEETPHVELEGGPPPEMLAGRFSGGRISLGDADLGGVRAERIVVDLDPFDVDVSRSVLGGRLEIEGPLSGTLRAELSEEEVLRFVEARADVPVRELELEEGRMLVRSEASVLGVEVPVSVRGGLTLRGGSLFFEPRRMFALGAPVPEGLTEQLLAGTDFSYPLGGLPYGAEVSGVEVAENRLVLSGEVERIPLDRAIG